MTPLLDRIAAFNPFASKTTPPQTIEWDPNLSQSPPVDVSSNQVTALIPPDTPLFKTLDAWAMSSQTMIGHSDWCEFKSWVLGENGATENPPAAYRILQLLQSPTVATDIGLTEMDRFVLLELSKALESSQLTHSTKLDEMENEWMDQARQDLLNNTGVSETELQFRSKMAVFDIASPAVAPLLQDMASNKMLSQGMTETEMAQAVHDYVRLNFTYQSDMSPDGAKTDSWQSVEETIARRGGDCEDLAIVAGTMLAQLLMQQGVSKQEVAQRITLAAGVVRQGDDVVGHAVIRFRLETGESMAIDATQAQGVTAWADSGLAICFEGNEVVFKGYREVSRLFETSAQTKTKSNTNLVEDFSGIANNKMNDAISNLNTVLKTPLYVPIPERGGVDMVFYDKSGQRQFYPQGKDLSTIATKLGVSDQNRVFFFLEKHDISDTLGTWKNTMYTVTVNQDAFAQYINDIQEGIQHIMLQAHWLGFYLNVWAEQVYQLSTWQDDEQEREQKIEAMRRASSVTKTFDKLSGGMNKIQSSVDTIINEMFLFLNSINAAQRQRVSADVEAYGRADTAQAIFSQIANELTGAFDKVRLDVNNQISSLVGQANTQNAVNYFKYIQLFYKKMTNPVAATTPATNSNPASTTSYKNLPDFLSKSISKEKKGGTSTTNPPLQTTITDLSSEWTQSTKINEMLKQFQAGFQNRSAQSGRGASIQGLQKEQVVTNDRASYWKEATNKPIALAGDRDQYVQMDYGYIMSLKEDLLFLENAVRLQYMIKESMTKQKRLLIEELTEAQGMGSYGKLNAAENQLADTVNASISIGIQRITTAFTQFELGAQGVVAEWNNFMDNRMDLYIWDYLTGQRVAMMVQMGIQTAMDATLPPLSEPTGLLIAGLEAALSGPAGAVLLPALKQLNTNMVANAVAEGIDATSHSVALAMKGMMFDVYKNQVSKRRTTTTLMQNKDSRYGQNGISSDLNPTQTQNITDIDPKTKSNEKYLSVLDFSKEVTTLVSLLPKGFSAVDEGSISVGIGAGQSLNMVGMEGRSTYIKDRGDGEVISQGQERAMTQIYNATTMFKLYIMMAILRSYMDAMATAAANLVGKQKSQAVSMFDSSIEGYLAFINGLNDAHRYEITDSLAAINSQITYASTIKNAERELAVVGTTMAVASAKAISSALIAGTVMPGVASVVTKPIRTMAKTLIAETAQSAIDIAKITEQYEWGTYASAFNRVAIAANDVKIGGQSLKLDDLKESESNELPPPIKTFFDNKERKELAKIASIDSGNTKLTMAATGSSFLDFKQIDYANLSDTYHNLTAIGSQRMLWIMVQQCLYNAYQNILRNMFGGNAGSQSNIMGTLGTAMDAYNNAIMGTLALPTGAVSDLKEEASNRVLAYNKKKGEEAAKTLEYTMQGITAAGRIALGAASIFSAYAARAAYKAGTANAGPLLDALRSRIVALNTSAGLMRSVGEIAMGAYILENARRSNPRLKSSLLSNTPPTSDDEKKDNNQPIMELKAKPGLSELEKRWLEYVLTEKKETSLKERNKEFTEKVKQQDSENRFLTYEVWDSTTKTWQKKEVVSKVQATTSIEQAIQKQEKALKEQAKGSTEYKDIENKRDQLKEIQKAFKKATVAGTFKSTDLTTVGNESNAELDLLRVGAIDPLPSQRGQFWGSDIELAQWIEQKRTENPGSTDYTIQAIRTQIKESPLGAKINFSSINSASTINEFKKLGFNERESERFERALEYQKTVTATDFETRRQQISQWLNKADTSPNQDKIDRIAMMAWDQAPPKKQPDTGNEGFQTEEPAKEWMKKEFSQLKGTLKDDYNLSDSQAKKIWDRQLIQNYEDLTKSSDFKQADAGQKKQQLQGIGLTDDQANRLAQLIEPNTKKLKLQSTLDRFKPSEDDGRYSLSADDLENSGSKSGSKGLFKVVNMADMDRMQRMISRRNRQQQVLNDIMLSMADMMSSAIEDMGGGQLSKNAYRIISQVTSYANNLDQTVVAWMFNAMSDLANLTNEQGAATALRGTMGVAANVGSKAAQSFSAVAARKRKKAEEKNQYDRSTTIDDQRLKTTYTQSAKSKQKVKEAFRYDMAATSINLLSGLMGLGILDAAVMLRDARNASGSEENTSLYAGSLTFDPSEALNNQDKFDQTDIPALQKESSSSTSQPASSVEKLESVEQLEFAGTAQLEIAQLMSAVYRYNYEAQQQVYQRLGGAVSQVASSWKGIMESQFKDAIKRWIKTKADKKRLDELQKIASIGRGEGETDQQKDLGEEVQNIVKLSRGKSGVSGLLNMMSQFANSSRNRTLMMLYSKTNGPDLVDAAPILMGNAIIKRAWLELQNVGNVKETAKTGTTDPSSQAVSVADVAALQESQDLLHGMTDPHLSAEPNTPVARSPLLAKPVPGDRPAESGPVTVSGDGFGLEPAFDVAAGSSDLAGGGSVPVVASDSAPTVAPAGGGSVPVVATPRSGGGLGSPGLGVAATSVVLPSGPLPTGGSPSPDGVPTALPVSIPSPPSTGSTDSKFLATLHSIRQEMAITLRQQIAQLRYKPKTRQNRDAIMTTFDQSSQKIQSLINIQWRELSELQLTEEQERVRLRINRFQGDSTSIRRDAQEWIQDQSRIRAFIGDDATRERLQQELTQGSKIKVVSDDGAQVLYVSPNEAVSIDDLNTLRGTIQTVQPPTPLVRRRSLSDDSSESGRSRRSIADGSRDAMPVVPSSDGMTSFVNQLIARNQALADWQQVGEEVLDRQKIIRTRIEQLTDAQQALMFQQKRNQLLDLFSNLSKKVPDFQKIAELKEAIQQRPDDGESILAQATVARGIDPRYQTQDPIWLGFQEAIQNHTKARDNFDAKIKKEAKDLRKQWFDVTKFDGDRHFMDMRYQFSITNSILFQGLNESDRQIMKSSLKVDKKTTDRREGARQFAEFVSELVGPDTQMEYGAWLAQKIDDTTQNILKINTQLHQDDLTNKLLGVRSSGLNQSDELDSVAAKTLEQKQKLEFTKLQYAETELLDVTKVALKKSVNLASETPLQSLLRGVVNRPQVMARLLQRLDQTELTEVMNQLDRANWIDTTPSESTPTAREQVLAAIEWAAESDLRFKGLNNIKEPSLPQKVASTVWRFLSSNSDLSHPSPYHEIKRVTGDVTEDQLASRFKTTISKVVQPSSNWMKAASLSVQSILNPLGTAPSASSAQDPTSLLQAAESYLLQTPLQRREEPFPSTASGWLRQLRSSSTVRPFMTQLIRRPLEAMEQINVLMQTESVDTLQQLRLELSAQLNKASVLAATSQAKSVFEPFLSRRLKGTSTDGVIPPVSAKPLQELEQRLRTERLEATWDPTKIKGMNPIHMEQTAKLVALGVVAGLPEATSYLRLILNQFDPASESGQNETPNLPTQIQRAITELESKGMLIDRDRIAKDMGAGNGSLLMQLILDQSPPVNESLLSETGVDRVAKRIQDRINKGRADDIRDLVVAYKTNIPFLLAVLQQLRLPANSLGGVSDSATIHRAITSIVDLVASDPTSSQSLDRLLNAMRQQESRLIQDWLDQYDRLVPSSQTTLRQVHDALTQTKTNQQPVNWTSYCTPDLSVYAYRWIQLNSTLTDSEKQTYLDEFLTELNNNPHPNQFFPLFQEMATNSSVDYWLHTHAQAPLTQVFNDYQTLKVDPDQQKKLKAEQLKKLKAEQLNKLTTVLQNRSNPLEILNQLKSMNPRLYYDYLTDAPDLVLIQGTQANQDLKFYQRLLAPIQRPQSSQDNQAMLDLALATWKLQDDNGFSIDQKLALKVMQGEFNQSEQVEIMAIFPGTMEQVQSLVVASNHVCPDLCSADELLLNTGTSIQGLSSTRSMNIEKAMTTRLSINQALATANPFTRLETELRRLQSQPAYSERQFNQQLKVVVKELQSVIENPRIKLNLDSKDIELLDNAETPWKKVVKDIELLDNAETPYQQLNAVAKILFSLQKRQVPRVSNCVRLANAIWLREVMHGRVPSQPTSLTKDTMTQLLDAPPAISHPILSSALTYPSVASMAMIQALGEFCMNTIHQDRGPSSVDQLKKVDQLMGEALSIWMKENPSPTEAEIWGMGSLLRNHPRWVALALSKIPSQELAPWAAELRQSVVTQTAYQSMLGVVSRDTLGSTPSEVQEKWQIMTSHTPVIGQDDPVLRGLSGAPQPIEVSDQSMVDTNQLESWYQDALKDGATLSGLSEQNLYNLCVFRPATLRLLLSPTEQQKTYLLQRFEPNWALELRRLPWFRESADGLLRTVVRVQSNPQFAPTITPNDRSVQQAANRSYHEEDWDSLLRRLIQDGHIAPPGLPAAFWQVAGGSLDSPMARAAGRLRLIRMDDSDRRSVVDDSDRRSVVDDSEVDVASRRSIAMSRQSIGDGGGPFDEESMGESVSPVGLGHPLWNDGVRQALMGNRQTTTSSSNKSIYLIQLNSLKQAISDFDVQTELATILKTIQSYGQQPKQQEMAYRQVANAIIDSNNVDLILPILEDGNLDTTFHLALCEAIKLKVSLVHQLLPKLGSSNLDIALQILPSADRKSLLLIAPAIAKEFKSLTTLNALVAFFENPIKREVLDFALVDSNLIEPNSVNQQMETLLQLDQDVNLDPEGVKPNWQKLELSTVHLLARSALTGFNPTITSTLTMQPWWEKLLRQKNTIPNFMAEVHHLPDPKFKFSRPTIVVPMTLNRFPLVAHMDYLFKNDTPPAPPNSLALEAKIQQPQYQPVVQDFVDYGQAMRLKTRLNTQIKTQYDTGTGNPSDSTRALARAQRVFSATVATDSTRALARAQRVFSTTVPTQLSSEERVALRKVMNSLSNRPINLTVFLDLIKKTDGSPPEIEYSDMMVALHYCETIVRRDSARGIVPRGLPEKLELDWLIESLQRLPYQVIQGSNPKLNVAFWLTQQSIEPSIDIQEQIQLILSPPAVDLATAVPAPAAPPVAVPAPAAPVVAPAPAAPAAAPAPAAPAAAPAVDPVDDSEAAGVWGPRRGLGGDL